MAMAEGAARRAPTWLPRGPRRAVGTEELDRPGQPPALVVGSLRDLERINRRLGGVRLTLGALDRLTDGIEPGMALTVLDVATGGGDMLPAIEAWAWRRGWRVRAVGVDASPAITRAARGLQGRSARLVVGDGRRLPIGDGRVDVAVCSLVIHHLEPDDAVLLLREMGRVARRGVVINDLIRAWVGLVGAWVVGHVATRNPITRHDAPLSARRAYTRAELLDLAMRAGLEPVAIHGWLGYRVGIAARRSS
jgi:SAM-dependent methyltransferase